MLGPAQLIQSAAAGSLVPTTSFQRIDSRSSLLKLININKQLSSSFESLQTRTPILKQMQPGVTQANGESSVRMA